MTVRLSINAKAYEAVIARIHKPLSVLASEQHDFTIVAIAGDEQGTYSLRESQGAEASSVANILIVNTHHTRNNERTEWKEYFLPHETAQLFDIAAKTRVGLKLSVMDGKGGLVATDRFWITDDFRRLGRLSWCMPNPLGRSGGSHSGSGANDVSPFYSDNGIFVLSPFFFERARPRDQTSSQKTRYRTELEITRGIELNLEDVKRIESVKCELICDP